MKVLLALYPNSIGYGYGCIELPQKLVDAGVVKTRPLCNGPLLSNIEKAIDFYQPHIILLREGASIHKKGERNRKLIGEIQRLALIKNLPVFEYSRYQVKDVFELFGATTKHEISQKIVEWLPELADRAPKQRKLWSAEDYNMGLFDALALAYTHEYLKK